MTERTQKQAEPEIPPAAVDQAAEHEAARRRILAQAEAERTPLDDTTQAVRVGRRPRR
ncbi:hypothetical protein [Micromonospora yangpuensis]|uniref:Uncharacterized protein n=1 Tax=Micromonospora yangpuensis TaxID=683228 RepID=A0A1C6VEB2_9ACTN|nr:hypothetical protein [Micromonospora yangpuensis]GGM14498.1 hypothetical protein GCM10012279_35740 [Micromonospora yangpuensis]SCL64682.1 hypothetical protein GA0070617_5531 [Micromonospora yangpuensis]